MSTENTEIQSLKRKSSERFWKGWNFEDPENGNITLLTSNGRLYASGDILCIYSGFFRTLIRSQMKKRGTSLVELPEENVKDLILVLEAIYDGASCIDPSISADQITRTIAGLYKYSVYYTVTDKYELFLETCHVFTSDLFIFADKHNLNKVVEICIRNFDQINKKKDFPFRELSSETLAKLFEKKNEKNRNAIVRSLELLQKLYHEADQIDVEDESRDIKKGFELYQTITEKVINMLTFA